ncbi:NAD-dependent epimerase/dehydratase family protein [Agrobacterium sp. MOPV5]|uniref:NAD-dependent epimerase/dehydratase family protein n=1 Tax=Agrobacterium leguminum TaxID=2792015 RepID=UPI0018C33E84|nr:NAD-dependent epimerase/dehydratase family protein [Agrobacterium leguminum]MBG0511628.1 NAD-dependent epimerase/dehydratase family protein [Agrobacterium leguminum]
MREISSKPVIFITGATGYIGGSFIELMISRGYLQDFTISALVRRERDAEMMREIGVEPVVGSLDDSNLLRRESARASIVFNTANCDHQPSARAIVQGLSEYAKATGTRPILIHTSGAGVLSTNSKGTGVSLEEDTGAVLWDDADAAAHAAIPAHAPHRIVDLEVFAAARSGLIKTYLVVPPTVFGRGVGPFAENRMSIQLPRLVYQSLVNRRALYVGPGKAQWTNVHVADLAELYLLILDAALKGAAPEGLEGLYYPATEYFTWSDVSDRIGQVLYQKGLIESSVAATGLQPGWFWGSNVRTKCTNGQKLGWKPISGGTAEMLADIEWDAELIIRMLASKD